MRQFYSSHEVAARKVPFEEKQDAQVVAVHIRTHFILSEGAESLLRFAVGELCLFYCMFNIPLINAIRKNSEADGQTATDDRQIDRLVLHLGVLHTSNQAGAQGSLFATASDGISLIFPLSVLASAARSRGARGGTLGHHSRFPCSHN